MKAKVKVKDSGKKCNCGTEVSKKKVAGKGVKKSISRKPKGSMHHATKAIGAVWKPFGI